MIIGQATRLGDSRYDEPTLRSVSCHSLRAVRDYPNNQLIVDLVVVGKKCTVKIKNVLKPGKHQYTFHTMVGLAYCEAPTITKVSCAPL